MKKSYNIFLEGLFAKRKTKVRPSYFKKIKGNFFSGLVGLKYKF